MICSNITPQKVISKTMIEILIEPFKYEFMVRSTITAIASGTMLSLLGPFAINRNMGFMADAMAHATLPIIAIGGLWSVFNAKQGEWIDKDMFLLFIGLIVAGLILNSGFLFSVRGTHCLESFPGKVPL